MIAIATYLAEFVGAAIALNLLFGVPPFVAGLMTAVYVFAILELTRGHRKFQPRDHRLSRDRLSRLPLRPAAGRRRQERVRQARSRPSRCACAQRAAGRRHPRRDGHAGMLVLPALGAHQLAREGGVDSREARAAALPGAGCPAGHGPGGFINLTRPRWRRSSSTTPAAPGWTTPDEVSAFNALLGGGAALAFAVALLASGLSSSKRSQHLRRPGRDAGLHQPPDSLFARRVITMAPSLIVLAIGVNPSMMLAPSHRWC